jgi:hypothetical protein
VTDMSLVVVDYDNDNDNDSGSKDIPFGTAVL